MPAVVSHYLLAERIYDDLLEFQPHLSIDHTALCWGALGPDIFFLHRFLPFHKGRSIQAYGRKLHNTNAAKMINYFVSFAHSHQSDIAMSYTLGFITHYAFDSTAHPFVIYFADVMAKQKGNMHISVCHNDIEANLDTLFLRYERKQKISSFPLQKASPLKESVNRVIAEMWHGFLLTYFGDNIPEEELYQTQKDWHTSLVLLNDKGSVKKNAIRLGEKILRLKPMLSPMLRTVYPDLSFDYANMSHTEWYSPIDQTVHTENFFELTDISEEKSLTLISSILANRPLKSSQCQEPFSGKILPQNLTD